MTHSVPISSSDEGGSTLGVTAGQSSVADVLSPGEATLDLEQSEVVGITGRIIVGVYNDLLDSEGSPSGAVRASSHDCHFGGFETGGDGERMINHRR